MANICHIARIVFFIYLCSLAEKNQFVGSSLVGLSLGGYQYDNTSRGKSGQHRVPYRLAAGRQQCLANGTENNRLSRKEVRVKR